MRLKLIIGSCLLVFMVCLFQGCGHAPQMSPPNRKILEALQTAVSAKKVDWLAAVETQVAEKRTNREMSDTEFNAISGIIKKAKSGNWKEALKDSFTLSDGQRPSAQDLASLKGNKSSKQSVPN